MAERDPDVKIEIEGRDARIVIRIGDTVIADCSEPCVVRQTDSPVARYYVAPADVRFDLLEESATVTHCPYKGDATHLSARIDGELHPDVAWTYEEPLPGAEGIAGYVSFYDDRVAIDISAR